MAKYDRDRVHQKEGVVGWTNVRGIADMFMCCVTKQFLISGRENGGICKNNVLHGVLNFMQQEKPSVQVVGLFSTKT